MKDRWTKDHTGNRTKNLVWAAVVAVLLLVGGTGLAGALRGLDLAQALPGRADAAPSTPTASAASGSASAAASPAPSPSRSLTRFDPSASPAENLTLFTRTLETAARSTASSSVDAATLTGALASAGFAPSAMQRSADRTSANLQAPVLTVSVHVGTDCLIGQFVRSEASVSAEIAAPLAQGTCLIGRQPAA